MRLHSPAHPIYFDFPIPTPVSASPTFAALLSPELLSSLPSFPLRFHYFCPQPHFVVKFSAAALIPSAQIGLRLGHKIPIGASTDKQIPAPRPSPLICSLPPFFRHSFICCCMRSHKAALFAQAPLLGCAAGQPVCCVLR
jgi:hypothetical protein